jgi:hypothetical protein
MPKNPKKARAKAKKASAAAEAQQVLSSLQLRVKKSMPKHGCGVVGVLKVN